MNREESRRINKFIIDNCVIKNRNKNIEIEGVITKEVKVGEWNIQDLKRNESESESEKYEIDREKWINEIIELETEINSIEDIENPDNIEILNKYESDKPKIEEYISEETKNIIRLETNIDRVEFEKNKELINFTGQHPVLFYDDSINIEDIESKAGYIVVSSGKYRSLNTENKKIYENCMAKNITVNNSVPYVLLSNKEKDKSAFGVISNKVETLNITPLKEELEKYDKYIQINSLGEGAIWVSDIKGNLENGDYITTSVIPGIGEKQDSDILHNYTVAKITMNCDFNPQKKERKYKEKETNNNGEEILTLKSEKTIKENIIEDKEYELKYVKITGELITEEEYNTEYAVDNTSVYKLALVGCTYHCG